MAKEDFDAQETTFLCRICLMIGGAVGIVLMLLLPRYFAFAIYFGWVLIMGIKNYKFLKAFEDNGSKHF
jgi:hypothetical protein